MSYILEALKKAQAERQLGSTPTIHASQLHLADAAGARQSRLPLVASVVVAMLAVGAAVAFYLRPATTPAPAATVNAGRAVAATAPAAQPDRAAAPVPRPAAPILPAAKESARAAVVVPAPAASLRSAEAPAAAPAATTQAAARSPAAATAEHLPLLRELPNGGAGIPKVELGGYIYSDNPADRLILVDKELRKEGDQVAPGLVLEKLGPDAAVMNYRGTRFRIPY